MGGKWRSNRTRIVDVADPPKVVTLFLSGDVMTGRGIDQILAHPSVPLLFEPYVRVARDYIGLAEGANGPIPRDAERSYIWGIAIDEMQRAAPDLKVINLETAVTASDDHWPAKDIHYRMHPANIDCLRAAGIDCCVLANNHVLDWGYSGLIETLVTLQSADIATVGAGHNLQAAAKPVAFDLPGRGRIVVFAGASASSGVPPAWAATRDRPGVNFLDETSSTSFGDLAATIRSTKRDNDIVVFSIHWGGNWGYAVPREQRQLAHDFIREAGVDIVHGHSSHHVKGIEVFQGRLILYGCGDLLTDYEGISGYERYRGDLGLMYFASLHADTGQLAELRLFPTRMRRFQLSGASDDEVQWLANVLNREGRQFGTQIERCLDGALRLRW